jgi:tetratricopeptide (TPR) repeat protein
MNRNRTLLVFFVLFLIAAAVTGLTKIKRSSTTALAQSEIQNPPLTRDHNPNYPIPNPFYFEGKVDYELLGIDTPQNAWEYMQRGIHEQDDLEDTASAIADYRTSISMNSLQNGTCQLVTTAPVPSKLDPPPCMFTVRSRLGYLMLDIDPNEAIRLFQEVLQIDPLRLEINALIGEAYVQLGDAAADSTSKNQFYFNAVASFQAELALSPVTPQGAQLTGDEANNGPVHWELAEVYEKLGQNIDARSELDLYLKATKWHSDTYPWRIVLAQKKIDELSQLPGSSSPLNSQRPIVIARPVPGISR